MALTPETLPRHELVGLRVRVVESTDPGHVGVAGRVVDETTNTLLVGAVDQREAAESASGSEARAERHASDSGGSSVRQVPKRGAVFEFAIPADDETRTDEAAADREVAGLASEPGEAAGSRGEGVTYVTVDGDVLLARPARRTEHGADSTWR